MARQRISDTERAERVREWSRQASARRRVKLMEHGKEQLLCWIPSAIRQRLDALAIERNLSVSDTVCTLLSVALAPSIPSPPCAPPVNSLPLFDASVDRDSRILALKQEQPDLSNYAIAADVGCSEPTVRRALKRLNFEATL